MGGASCAFLIHYTKVYDCYMPNECIKSVGDTVTTRSLFCTFSTFPGICVCVSVCECVWCTPRAVGGTEVMCKHRRLSARVIVFACINSRLRTSDSFRQRQCWRKNQTRKKKKKLVITQLHLVHELHRYTTSSGASEHRFTSFDLN